MKKLFWVIISIFIAAILVNWYSAIPKKKCEPKPEERKMVKEVIYEYSDTDSAFLRYGTYKEVFRIYNYHYKDSFYYLGERGLDNNLNKGKGFFLNEYGDTTHIIYTDYSNYPHR